MLRVPSFLKARTIMSRQHRFIRLPLVGTILLCLLVGVYLLVWKRFSKTAPAARIVKHSVETPADDAIAYWTADKMRNAKATPLPNVTALTRGKRQPRRPAPPSRPQQT